MRATLVTSGFSLLIGLKVAASDVKDAATFTPEQLRWSISAGATVRSIDADFHVARPAPLQWQRFVHGGNLGRGDVGIYSGGLGSARYDDGYVGPDYGLVFDTDHLPTGDAVGLIGSRGQISSTGFLDSFDVPISNATTGGVAM